MFIKKENNSISRFKAGIELFSYCVNYTDNEA